ncbi:uncharacterized protein LOC112342391 [Selaginella moellendorffii]|uniref:uncharacterized protein LOC112342391 n=1 Tax=Selaginella moellendorffii TaxID=88036 RepID=UPI000D1C7B85|nr:uncharacterized protein LOC112342391 [Selaginella moellendorffii]|eukprot:XP_024519895.1 uncharacterized protein LOC112342391 [Selaginella moellendorffii]
MERWNAEEHVRRFWESIPIATTTRCVCLVPRESITPSIKVSTPPEAQLERVHIELDTVTLKPGVSFLQSKRNKLLVRSVYRKFASLAIDILSGRVNSRRGDSPIDHLIIGGSPGTGMTSFGYYLLTQLRIHPDFANRQVIWEESCDSSSGLSYFFRGSQVVEGVVGSFDSQRTQDTVYLCNAPLLRPQHAFSHAILFSSGWDEVKYSRKFVRENGNAMIVCMPPWDVCELALLYASAGLLNSPGDFTAVEQLFGFWGGSPRAVLDRADDPDWLCHFQAALLEARKEKRLDIAGALRRDPERFSHIFHLEPLDPEYKVATVVCASPHVEKTLGIGPEVEPYEDQMDYIKDNKLISDNAAIVGRKFAYLVHCLLASRDVKKLQFRSRRLDPGAVAGLESFDFGGNVVLFRKAGDIIAGKSGYFVAEDCPGSPNSCYDAVGVLLDGSAVMFRITRRARHDALLQHVQDAVVKFGRNTRFVYLVPNEMFDEYPMQRLVWGQVQMEWPCQVSVVGIPADFPLLILRFLQFSKLERVPIKVCKK